MNKVNKKINRRDGHHESAQQRVERLYETNGGPVMGWLLDEAARRSIGLAELSAALGVNYGYINQLRVGLKEMSRAEQKFIEACARFLGVPPIVVKLLAGQVSISDFAWPGENEEKMIERAYQKMKADPMAAYHLPNDDAVLSLEAKRSLVLLYGEVSGNDVLGLGNLPWMLQHLQRAAMIHNDNEVESLLCSGALTLQSAE